MGFARDLCTAILGDWGRMGEVISGANSLETRAICPKQGLAGNAAQRG